MFANYDIELSEIWARKEELKNLKKDLGLEELQAGLVKKEEESNE